MDFHNTDDAVTRRVRAIHGSGCKAKSKRSILLQHACGRNSAGHESACEWT